MAGIRVRYVGPREDWNGLVGTIVREVERSHGAIVKVRFDTLDGLRTVRKVNLIEVEDYSVQKRAQNTKVWEFNISRLAQIDYAKITEDLSWENPLAMVTTDDSALLDIVVFGPLYEKAMAIYAYGHPGSSFNLKEGSVVIQLESGADIQAVKDWAHEVRQAPWHDAYKAKVKVRLLTV